MGPGFRRDDESQRAIMTYAVKELYVTLQGEGAQTGRRAVFLRFAGCNLWSGREADRATSVCTFCDTDFVGTDGPGGGKFATADALAGAVAAAWGPGDEHRLTICTGGEPLLQLDTPLIDALHARAFAVGVETNGTQVPPPGLDWVCVSPKAAAPLALTTGDELKLVYPQPLAPPERFAGPRLRALLPAADGRAAARGEHAGRDPLLPRQPALAAVVADAQADGAALVPTVIPAKAGTHLSQAFREMGPGFRRDDAKESVQPRHLFLETQLLALQLGQADGVGNGALAFAQNRGLELRVTGGERGEVRGRHWRYPLVEVIPRDE